MSKRRFRSKQKKLAAMDAGIETARAAYSGLRPKLEAAQAKWEHEITHVADWSPTDGLIFRSDWAASTLAVDGKSGG